MFVRGVELPALLLIYPDWPVPDLYSSRALIARDEFKLAADD
jgi:hypothetical protein